MPTIIPVSDLRNYNSVLSEVSPGAPVYLTKNGRGRYAILDIEDADQLYALQRLANELARGSESGKREGWVSTEEVEAHFAHRGDDE